VLRVTSNEGRTTDGVAAGATRVAAEVNAFVRAHRTVAVTAATAIGATAAAGTGAGAASTNASVAGSAGGTGGDVAGSGHLASISFVGHSLGGIYARLAAALLFDPSRGSC